jgi:hypothetical protein
VAAAVADETGSAHRREVIMTRGYRIRVRPAALLSVVVLAAAAACGRADTKPTYRTFESPEAAVNALAQAVKSGKLDDVSAIFGPESQKLIDSSDPASARRNQEIFTVALAERWRLESPDESTRTLVVGNEEWPFPIPIVRENGGWRFDAAAGVEEILARRIGRNELAAIRICRTYVVAQHLYARTGHDGRPPALYAATFRSEPGKQNGLYWPSRPGERRSPLGDLVATAAAEGRIDPAAAEPAPFHGYFFKILTAQGASAPGGAHSYVRNGALSDGFALVAWPAQYDVTGVMTFIVNQDGIVREKDLGPETAAARTMTAYDPDPSWTPVR